MRFRNAHVIIKPNFEELEEEMGCWFVSDTTAIYNKKELLTMTHGALLLTYFGRKTGINIYCLLVTKKWQNNVGKGGDNYFNL